MLVCGNAFTLADDLQRARALFPEAPAIAVNGASGNVKALALFSLHPDKLRNWIGLQERKFGAGFTVHSCARGKALDRCTKTLPWVDHWWNTSARGSSGWAARKVAERMGFGPVVLCGVPIDRGGYQGGGLTKLWQKDEVVDHFRRLVEDDIEWHAGAYSMSGWTAQLLGQPPGAVGSSCATGAPTGAVISSLPPPDAAGTRD